MSILIFLAVGVVSPADGVGVSSIWTERRKEAGQDFSFHDYIAE